MTADQYVSQVIAKYAVPTGPNSVTEINANRIIPTLRRWAGVNLNEIVFSGSYAKGTGVNTSTDIDLFISMQANTPGSLKDIYTSLFTFANQQGWTPRRQNVSIGITYNNTKIDLVPARIQPGYRVWHSLYVRKRDTWTQTNINEQINIVRRSQRTNEIRAVKVWRNLNGLDFPSFYLELVVIRALHNRSTATLADNVWAAIGFIADSIIDCRVEDPANTNNIISEDLTYAEKRHIAEKAAETRKATQWQQVIW